MDFAEKVIDKVVDAIKETKRHVHAKDGAVVHPEKKKIALPVNPNWKTDVQNKVEQSQQKSTATVKKIRY